MRMRLAIIGALVAITTVHAQQAPPLPISDGQVVRLWEGAAPGAQGSDEIDIPVLTVYLPRVMQARTAAIVVCPGGAYRVLASNHEGRQVAAYLNSLGIAAFVLRYRLGPKYHHPIESATRSARSGCCAHGHRIGGSIRLASASWGFQPAVTSR
jgi:acetyl esterase/lipase